MSGSGVWAAATLLVLVLAAGAPPSGALSTTGRPGGDPVFARSLEYLICEAKAVMRVRVAEEVNGDYGIDVLEVLKGAPSRRQFVFQKLENPFPPRPLADGREFLIIATGLDHEDDPSHWDFQAAVPLSGVSSINHAPCRSMDGTILTESDQVMSVARAAVAAGNAAGWNRSAYVDIPPKRAGETTIVLQVPCDPRAQTLALRWAVDSDRDHRLNAARLLRTFDTPQSVQALRKLLADDTVGPRNERHPEREIYTVRRSAFYALRSLNVPNVTEPQIDVVPWPLAFVVDHAGGIAAICAILVLPPLAFAWGRRRRRTRGLFVERSSITRFVVGAAALGSVVLGLTLSYYWLVSYDEGASFVRVGESGWARALNSVSGKLQFAVLEGMPPAFTTAEWASGNANFENMWTGPEVKSRTSAYGFTYARAEPRSAPGGRATFVQSPYWVAVVLCTLLPAVWIAMRRAVVRGRRRADAGQCLACGYDLRQTPEQCPECGAVALPPFKRPATGQSAPPNEEKLV